jgi:hypothetical protein
VSDPPAAAPDVLAAAAPGGWETRTLTVGVWGLVVGLLVYFAPLSPGGGLAGILLSSVIWWAVFEFAVLPVRSAWRSGQRVTAQHARVGGCLTAVSLCGGLGLLSVFGPMLFIGLFIGPLISYLSHRKEVMSFMRSMGLDTMLQASARPSLLIQVPGLRPVFALVGLVSILGCLIFIGLGTVRALEAVSVVTSFCTHPCAMIHGVWVDVIPRSDGAVVTRLDSGAIELHVRFRNDMASAAVVGRDDFTLEMPPTIYPQLTDRPTCRAWPPQTLNINDTSPDMTMCFAIPESDNVDYRFLVLDWRQPGFSVQLPLDKSDPNGVTEFGSSPSPS